MRDEHDRPLAPEEALLDSMLGEALGHAPVPDVASRVLARVRWSNTEPRAAMRRARWFSLLLGAGLGAAAAAAVAVCWPRPVPEACLVPVVVRDGGIDRRTATRHEHLPAGTDTALALAPGDVLAATVPATLEIAQVGVLRLGARAEVVVRALAWRRDASATVATGVTVQVLAGEVETSAAAVVRSAHAGETIDVSASDPSRNTDLARVQVLERELAAARARVLALEQAAARAPVTPPSAAAGNAPPAPAGKLSPPFSHPGLESAVAAIDWDLVGDSLPRLLRVLDTMAGEIERHGDASLATMNEGQRLNADLAAQALHAMQAGVPGAGMNGPFTHPVMVANQAHAALAKAGVPLSSEQVDRLRRASSALAFAEDARRAALPPDALALESALVEIAGKERFYVEVRELLTPAQQAVLFPPSVAGTVVDTFGPGVAWYGLASIGVVAGPDDFAADAARALVRGIGADEAAARAILDIVRRAVDELPPETFTRAIGARERRGFSPYSLFRAHAEWQARLLRRLHDSRILDPGQRAKVRAALEVFVVFQKA